MPKLSIIVTEEQRRRYKAAAAHTGDTIARFVRMCLNEWSSAILAKVAQRETIEPTRSQTDDGQTLLKDGK